MDIITLMVFLVQKNTGQRFEGNTIKLNELLAASQQPGNGMIDIKDLSEAELDILRGFIKKSLIYSWMLDLI